MHADEPAPAETTGGRWPPAAIVLIAAAAATRLVNLGSAPYFFSDEALNAETALGMMRTGSMVRYFFDFPALSIGKPIFHYWPMAASFELFGVGVWQGRLISALLGIGTAAVVYLLARHLFGRAAGLAALALYTFSRYTLYMDRSMKEDAQAAFFALLGIYLFVLAWERRRSPLMAAAGGALGLSLFTKPSGFFVPLGLAAYVIARWLRDREHRRCFVALIPLALGSALPMAIWLIYILHVRDHPPYDVPLEQVTRGLTPYSVYGALHSPLGQPGLKALASGALHLFANLLLRDEVRLLGLVGLMWMLLARRPRWAIPWACIGAALFCYALARWQSPRYLHVAYIVAIVCAGAVLGAAYTAGRAASARRALVVLAVAAMCFKSLCFETLPHGLRFRPILEPDTPEVRAMAWLRHNIPRDQRLYCAANVGVFSGHEYVPLDMFAGNPAAVAAFDVRYLVIDRYYAHGVLEGYYRDPGPLFELRKVHEIPGGQPTDRVEIYRIEGTRDAAPPEPSYIHRERGPNFY